MLEARKTIGRYEVRDCIGRGGMGALFRGHDPVLDREVAIKTMLADFSHDEDGRTRFYREARAAARLQHRNIVTLFDFGEDEGTLYIVMEFLVGQSVAEHVRSGAKLTIERVLDIGAQLCTGLHFAHLRGVVHRDIKPPNIWLNEDGGVKVLDFGIAKFGDTTLTRIGGVVGSVSYMSPEQVTGDVDLDGRSDIFSVGIVLYELLSGQRPFRAETPTGIMMKIVNEPPPPLDVPGVPPQLVAVIARALEKDRAKRYQYANEMAAELRGLQIVMKGQSAGSARLVTTVPIAGPPVGAASPASALPGAPSSSAVSPAAGSPAAGSPGAASPGAASPGAASPATAFPVAASATLTPKNIDGDQVTHLGRSGREALAPAPTPAEFVASDEHDLMGELMGGGSHPAAADRVGGSGWSPGLAEDLVGEAVITPPSQFAAIADARAKALSQSTWTGRAAAEWLTRWPGLAVAGGAVAIAAFAFVLLMRAESPGVDKNGAGSAEKPTAAGVVAPNTSAGAKTPVAPVAPEPGVSPKPAPAPPPVETETDVRVLLSGPYAFSVVDEKGRSISGFHSTHDLRFPPKQVLILEAPQVYYRQRVTVEGKPGGTMTVKAPAVGNLDVLSTRETCHVWLDNYDLYYPPIVDKKVASGKHRVSQKCPDGDLPSELVTISPGVTTHVKLGIP